MSFWFVEFYSSKRRIEQPFYFEKRLWRIVAQREVQPKSPMQVSIIIPVFNEAPLIRPFLSNLRERTRGAEIIVVDGGSTDGTDRWRKASAITLYGAARAAVPGK